MNNFLMSLILLLSISGCSYKVDVKAGFEKSNEIFLGVSEWPLEPITLHLWKENNIGYKCDGTFTKGNTSGGTINDGAFHLKCTDGQEINGNWYSPSGMNNLVAQGKNNHGQKFHMIAGTELSIHPNLLNTLKSKIYAKKDLPLVDSRIKKNKSWECEVQWIMNKGKKIKPTNKSLQKLSIELIDNANKLYLKTENGESYYSYNSFIDISDSNLGIDFIYKNRFISIFQDKTLLLGDKINGIDAKYYCKDMTLDIMKFNPYHKN